jgi:hypothetical protein
LRARCRSGGSVARKRLARSSFPGNEEVGDAAPERIGRSRKVQAG